MRVARALSLTRLRRIAMVGLAAGAVAACSSSSRSSSSSPTSPSATSPPATGPGATGSSSASPTGSTLKIGVIASLTGAPTAANDARTTAKTWESWINGHDGIAGHPVNVLVADDRSNIATSVSTVQGWAQDKSILAVIDDSSYDTGWQKIPGPAGLPVICGSETGNGFVCQSSPDFFPSGNTVIAGVSGQTLVAKLLNKPKFGVVYCSELPACAQAVPLNKGFAKQQGVDVVYAEAASESAPDYTAQCLGLKSAGALVVFGYAGGTKIAGDCARQSYRPTWVVAQGAFNAQYRKDSNFNGTVGPIGTWPWFIAQTPAQNDFKTAFGNAWPNFDQFVSPYTATSTWAALQLFATAAAHVGPDPTRADIFDGIYGLGPKFTLGGLIPPETIVKGKPTVNPCFFMAGIQNGQYLQPFGSQQYCQPSSP